MKKSLKSRVFEIFKSGGNAQDVLKSNLKVSDRTVYRWWREYLKMTGQSKPEKLIEPPKVIKHEVQEPDNLDSDWIQYLTSESLKNCISAGKLLDKLNELLLEALNESDINTRLVSSLSNAIANHSRIQREYGMFDLLNANLAFKILENAGFVVMLPYEQTTHPAIHKRAR